MEILQINLMILVGLIPVAVLLSWGLLRGLDHLGGINFKGVISHLSTEPIALSIYFGARFVGVLWLVGTLCSRFV